MYGWDVLVGDMRKWTCGGHAKMEREPMPARGVYGRLAVALDRRVLALMGYSAALNALLIS